MFYEIAQQYQQTFEPFHLYPSISDRDTWSSFDPQWRKEAILLAEHYLNIDFPSITATEFMNFTRTGNRVDYENKFFSKRLALDALVLGECVENKGRFLDAIINGIYSICEESAWQLPAHNSYIRDTPQLPLPDSTNPVLDLFACETASILGTIYYLIKDTLDTISPFITKRIAYELEHRIFTPYCNTHFWWMGNGQEPMNNWTIWCTQNVLLSAFLTLTDENLKHIIFLKACQSTDYFLEEYGEDGCCDEGAQYYRHAGLCLFNVLELCNAVTHNYFSHLYDTLKIRNIATYIQNVHIQDKYYVNFADCSPIAGRAGVREFLFANRTANTSMMQFAATDFLAGKLETLLLPNENNLYYRLQNGCNIAAIKSYAQSHPTTISYKDVFYPSVGLFVARDSSLCLAVKAGDNADSHNHNDTGSFIVYKQGQPLIIDVGVESYTKKTFSPRRYEIWTMQSGFHNLPTINHTMQHDGKEFTATLVTYHMDKDICNISMNLKDAYPKDSKLKTYTRQASLIKGREILIEDTFTFEDTLDVTPSIMLSLMTYDKPELLSDCNGLSFSIGEQGNLHIKAGTLHAIETIPITDARLQTAWKHDIYRILIKVVDNKITMHIY